MAQVILTVKSHAFQCAMYRATYRIAHYVLRAFSLPQAIDILVPKKNQGCIETGHNKRKQQ